MKHSAPFGSSGFSIPGFRIIVWKTMMNFFEKYRRI